MPSPENFVHLHVHSHFSLLDGACRVESLVARAVELGMPALAITDHGNLHGVVQFVQAAEKAGIKPVIGYEAYVAPGSRHSREAAGLREAAHHLTLLAENEDGYRNLLKLSSSAYLEGFYYKPRIDKEILREHSKGLIALSGCLKGEVPHHLLAGDSEAAEAAARTYIDILGADNFFIELQDNGIEEQVRILEPLAALARKLKLRTVATNDIHYMNADDAHAHDALLCINTGKTLNDTQRMRFGTDAFYFRTPDEMRRTFAAYPDAIAATADIAARTHAKIDFKTFHFPVFVPPGGKSATQYLRDLSEAGFAQKYPGNPKDARDRLEYELDTIDKKGFSTYFLIVWDFLRFCHERGIPAGTRGSGCSSLVGYCIGISAVDPLRYRLMFERFLDPERKEMPDYDIDLCERRRGEVIEYVRQKYGNDNVAQIVTFGTLGAKAAIRDVGRVMGLPLAQVNDIAKKIPTELHITLADALEKEPELRTMIQNDSQVGELFEIAGKVEGLNRHSSTHAAGVVIADRPLTEYTALCRPGGGDVTTQWPMNDIAAVGLLKMDLLGLRTLTIIADAVALVRKQHPGFDIDDIPLDDQKTFDIFRNGETLGVFQFGSSGMRAMLRELRPDRVEDLIAANALYRPATLKAGMVDEFIKRKHDPSQVVYEHPILEEYLGESYGVMATQEQVMLTVHKLAGLSMSRSLSLVKAISKKKTEYIEATRADFMAGAEKNNVPANVAQRIFDLIVFFGGYGFNRAHSTAYALLAYKTAYLKAHHPVEFMAATLTCESGDIDTVVEYVAEIRRMGIEILPPCVNHSNLQFAVEHGKIRYGLGAIKGVGEKAAEAIVAARQKHGAFRNFYDFCDTIDLHAVNRQVVEALLKCGAFDALGARRSQLALVLDGALRIGAEAQQDRERGQFSLFGKPDPKVEKGVRHSLPDVPEWPESTRLAGERETLGLYMTSHPLASHEELLRTYSTLNTKDAAAAEDTTPILIGGLIEGLKLTITKSGRAAGKKMARFTLEDLDGSIQCVMFAEDYERAAALIVNGTPVFLRGIVTHRTGDPNVQASEAFAFHLIRPQFSRSIVLALPSELATETALAELKTLLATSKGKTPVYLEVPDDTGETQVLETNLDLWVTVTDPLHAALVKFLGAGRVRLDAKSDRAHGTRQRGGWGNGGGWNNGGNGSFKPRGQ